MAQNESQESPESQDAQDERRPQHPVFNVYYPFQGTTPVHLNQAMRVELISLLDDIDGLEPHFVALKRQLKEKAPRPKPE